jgi:hypothetical protein
MAWAGGGRTYNLSMIPQHPQRRSELLVERAGLEVLIYSASQAAPPAGAGGAVHALNPTAALIWDLCDGARNLAEIESAVRLAFSVPAERDLAADVRATIAEFQVKGLLLD